MTTLGQSDGIRVFFGGHSSFRLAPHRSVFIVPSSGTWNDFGFKTECLFLFRPSDSDKVVEIGSRIGFLDNDVTDNRGIEERLANSKNGYIALDAKAEIRFFTMLPDMEAYRNVSRQLGQEDSAALLVAVNDIVACSEFTKGLSWIDLATKTEVFNYSFLRSSDSYFAFKNAHSILRGLEHEELGNISESLRLDFALAGMKNRHELEFNFDHHNPTLPKRMAVVIGENGVGKSQALRHIALSALHGTGELRVASTESRPIINRLLAFAPTKESESLFPRESRQSYRITYRRFSLNRARPIRGRASVADLVIQLARSEQTIKEKDRWDLFLEAINTLRAPEQLVLPTYDGAPFVPVLSLRRAGPQESLRRYASVDITKAPMRQIDGALYPLSSGEFSFLTFAAQVSLNIENGTLLLFDEPETHLHPRFISKFIAVLDKLLELTGSSAIIATHSAYFVREVFREQVTVLRHENGYALSERPRLRTFGGDVGAISFFVFGEDEPSILANGVLDDLLKEHSQWEDLYAQLKEELSMELLIALRRRTEQGRE